MSALSEVGEIQGDDSETGWNPLASKARTLFVFESLAWGSILSLMAAVIYFWPESWPLAGTSRPVALIFASVSLAAFGSSMVSAIRFQRWRWRLSSHALELKSGVLGSRHLAIPRPRILYLAFRAGPVRRRLGLYEVEVHTAGSIPEVFLIPGLTLDDVAILRSELDIE